jgi:hypothetical protein
VSRPTPLRPFRYVVVIGCAAAILAASVVDPGDGMPRMVFGVGTTVYLHVVAYTGLATALGYAARSVDRRTLAVVVTVATVYGAGIEILQWHIPYRTTSAVDAVINAVGSAFGAGAWRLLTRPSDIDGD